MNVLIAILVLVYTYRVMDRRNNICYFFSANLTTDLVLKIKNDCVRELLIFDVFGQ